MKCLNRRRGLPRAVALASVLLLVVGGCKSPAGRGVAVGRQALAGKDGALTVSAAKTVNAYSALAANANAGASSVTVAAISDLASASGTDSGLQPLGAGDLLLVIQMAGATINAADTAPGGISDYGSVSSLNNAGNYELAGVASVSGSTIALDCGLKNSYSVTGKAQVIRVPQYTTLTVTSGGSITAPAWNGTVGGVVAVQADTTLELDGTIDVSGKGFRGGIVHAGLANAVTDQPTYRSISPNAGGQKGESIAGAPADYDNLFSGQYGRGAPANGGGGGNWHNGGGGGGANAAASGLTWNGQGVMVHSLANDAAAWALDPGYALDGDFTNSPGGGRGGYTYSSPATDQDPTTLAPGNTAWAGNYRRERGGLGGHPLASSPAGRLFLGGGGGAGDGNNGFTGPGGNGGGLVFAIAGTVMGGGSILANGGDGAPANSTGVSGDGPGGGGGGGTVVVHADTLSGISVVANGGKGGSQHIAGTFEAEGPGGGGGGGYVALSGGTPAAVSVIGGLGGTTDSAGVNEFPSNGASAGHAGVAAGDATTLQYCSVVLDTTITSAPAKLTNVAAATFTFSSPQSGVTFECSLDGGAFADCECRLDGGTYGSCAASYTTPSDLAGGSHTLDVRAKDASGNVDDTPAHYDWTLDLVAPQTYILTGPADAGASSTGHFTFSSDETGELGVSYQCRLDSTNDADFATCPADYTISGLADGSHTLDVRAKDAAGNVDATPASYTWEVHALGLDAAVADAATDGEELEDGGAPDTGLGSADGPGTVILVDARPDVRAVDLATDRASDAGRDVPAIVDVRADAPAADAGVLEDATDDGGELDASVKDAQVVVVVEPRSVDASAAPDRVVVLPPDAAAIVPDAAVVVPATPDAPVVVTTENVKIMGSGFCAVNPVRDGTPGLFTLFLVGTFGLLVRRRRR